MKIHETLERYLDDKELTITYKRRCVNVNNYQELIDFNNKQVTIIKDNITIKVNGRDLVVTRMVDNEVLITGQIDGIFFE